ncbi:MAG: prepilin-type N-terminal cleavage/methylation domain-containing protein [Candidatus Harrisonbacteria bacterium]|nr:prepilin-type N-terminal cleavage/methylation domain-containing protein [Candidatus Harrisonbacteria bacterium]
MNKQKGQSLLEVLIGIAIATIFIAGSVGVIIASLRIGAQNKFSQIASELNHELAERVTVFAANDWGQISALNEDTDYYLQESGSFFSAQTGSEAIVVEGKSFSRDFQLSAVSRDLNNAIVSSGGSDDPATKLVTITTSWTDNGEESELSFHRYITRRHGLQVFHQTNWEEGPDVEGPVPTPGISFSSSTNIHYASSGFIIIADFAGQSTSSDSNINSTDHWAWNDLIGWIDFNTGTVVVSSTVLQGYASSGVGQIAFDCASSPSESCAVSYQVSNDGSGNLSGWAWNDLIGWISFSSSSPSYQVSIDPDSGEFSGWAWNNIVGWISFNCADPGICATSDYKVKTSWGPGVLSSDLTSSIFDTTESDGAAFHTIMWQGSQPTGTVVKFQLASSNNPSSTWNYLGPDGTGTSYYQPIGADIQTPIKKAYHNDQRYIRYKVFLESDQSRTKTPTVHDIIISWTR